MALLVITSYEMDTLRIPHKLGPPLCKSCPGSTDNKKKYQEPDGHITWWISFHRDLGWNPGKPGVNWSSKQKKSLHRELIMTYEELLVHWQVMLTFHLLSLWRCCFHSLSHSQITSSQSGCLASPHQKETMVRSPLSLGKRLWTSSHPSIFSLVFLHFYVSIQIIVILVLAFIRETHL